MKEKEILPFEEFCKMAAINREEFIHDDSPDFIKKDKSLGIELAEYHTDLENGSSKAREHEGLLKTIIKKAMGKYKRIAKHKSNVYLFPNIRREITVKINDIAEKLAKLIAGNNDLEIELSYREIPKDLYIFFEHIHIYPKPDYLTEIKWEIVEWALISNNLNSIREILKKKETSLSTYYKKINENWLLIYTSYLPCVGLEDFGQPSTCGEITPELENAEFESHFNKIFFMDRINKKVIQLKQQKKA
jgi:hypothetical protein